MRKEIVTHILDRAKAKCLVLQINTNEIIFIIPRNMQSNVIKQFTREPLAPQA
jgi:hypothetical protein